MSVLSRMPFPNFQQRTTIATIFLEHNERLLMLKRSKLEDQSNCWGVPGGKIEAGEEPAQAVLRELTEETQISLSRGQLTYHGQRYARVPGWDYIIHLFQATINNRSPVTLDPSEHSAHRWVSVHALKLLPLIKGQDEAFDIVYEGRLWQRTHDVTQRCIFQKGDHLLKFDAGCRLVINLIGTSGSGKGTQGDMLAKIYGIPTLSAGDIFRDEFRANSMLGTMVTNFDRQFFPTYLPDEVPIGMMVKRISSDDCALGFILDGFPRTRVQGDTTRNVLLRQGDLHIPLFMDVPESDIWQRLPGRSICPDCGHQVRRFDENPWPGFCPNEAASGKMVALEKRVEDIDRARTERRLAMFRDNREAIIYSLEQRDRVSTFPLDNSTPPEDVLHLLCTEIQSKMTQYYLQRT